MIGANKSSRERAFLALSGLIIVAAFVAAESLNHGRHDVADSSSSTHAAQSESAVAGPAGVWIYSAGYALCLVPFAVRRFRQPGMVRRALLGLGLQLLVGGLLLAALRPCLQAGMVLFAALVVGRAGEAVWRSGMLAGTGLLSLNAVAIGQHDPVETVLGIGVGWIGFRFAFASQLDLLDEPAPWRTVRHGIASLRLWLANDRAQWENAYEAGDWDFLASLRQRARHYVIAGMVRDYFPRGASVLDVGCGLGVLYPLIGDAVTSYVGIDVAEAAITRCRFHSGGDRRCSFQRVAFEDYASAERFDVVVLNELLYYFPLSSLEPTFRRALSLLRNEQSVLIISVCKNAKARLVARKLRRIAPAEQFIRVHNGFTSSHWTVSVYRRDGSFQDHGRQGGPPPPRHGREPDTPAAVL